MASLAYRPHCVGKQRHKSLGMALAAIRSLARRGVAIDSIRPYTCIYCHFWHVGHAGKRRAA